MHPLTAAQLVTERQRDLEVVRRPRTRPALWRRRAGAILVTAGLRLQGGRG